MKKVLALMMALCLLLALCACGAKEEAPAEAPAAEAPAAAPAVEGEASGEPGASGEAGGAMAGNKLDLSVNAVIPTADAPETYTADEAGWKEYMMDCAYYAMGTADSDGKLGSTYYDISVGNMTDMFVNMWGVDSLDAFIAAGGNPGVVPWSLQQGAGTPETVPDATEATE